MAPPRRTTHGHPNRLPAIAFAPRVARSQHGL